MTILKNARHEKFAQALAKGMSADAAHTAAGYKPSRGNASRLRANESIVERVAELQGSTARQITDVRNLARQCTARAVKTLERVMDDPMAPHSAQTAAAVALLDRGHGKAVQHIEAEVSVYDSLGLEEQQALLAALEMLDVADEAELIEAPRGLIGNGST